MPLFSSSTSPEDSIFATGKLGVLQLSLLSQADIDRLLGAHDSTEVDQILTELKLTDAIDQSLSKGPEIVNALGEWVQSETRKMTATSKHPVFSILWFTNDAPYISYALKKHHGLTSEFAREPICNWSAYSPSAYQAQIKEEVDSGIPVYLAQFIHSMANATNETSQRIDAEVSQFFATQKLSFAKVSGSVLIEKYVIDLINLENIRSSLRKFDTDTRNRAFLKGGSIPFSTFEKESEDIAGLLSFCSFPAHLSEKFRKTTTPTEFESACRDIINHDIAQMWNTQFTIEPVFAFAAIALSHIAFLRSVIIAKNNYFTTEDTAESLSLLIPAAHYS